MSQSDKPSSGTAAKHRGQRLDPRRDRHLSGALDDPFDAPPKDPPDETWSWRRAASEPDSIAFQKLSHEEQMQAIHTARAQRLAGGPVTMPAAPGKTRVQALLSALPVLMLLIGLAWFYWNETEQAGGEPILEQARLIEGLYKGISAMPGERLYLWLVVDGHEKGVRLSPEQRLALPEWQEGQSLQVTVAPTVAGSTSVWLVEALATDE